MSQLYDSYQSTGETNRWFHHHRVVCFASHFQFLIRTLVLTHLNTELISCRHEKQNIGLFMCVSCERERVRYTMRSQSRHISGRFEFFCRTFFCAMPTEYYVFVHLCLSGCEILVNTQAWYTRATYGCVVDCMQSVTVLCDIVAYTRYMPSSRRNYRQLASLCACAARNTEIENISQ